MFTHTLKGALLMALLAVMPYAMATAQTAKAKATPTTPKASKHLVRIHLTEEGSDQALMMAKCQLQPLGSLATTDITGTTTLHDIPNGRYTLTISYVGYATEQRIINVTGDTDLSIQLKPIHLGLNEVLVTAKLKAAGTSTSSTIGRQAIDHLQAMSLDDVMQLLPGHLMKNTDLTARSNLQIRSLVNNNTNAFGASIVVDGMPISNNGVLTQGDFSSTAFVGTDLRQVSADDIESVEVVRGIPSAEYGDLTSGLVVVNSKIGLTPWEVRAKINPGTRNYSIAKGLKLGQAGLINASADYAQAWGDPRLKTRSFDRYNFALGHSIDLSSAWQVTTKLRYALGKDWSGKDPDALQDGTFARSHNQSLTLTHNGKLSLSHPLSRALSYTLGLRLNQSDDYTSSIVSNSNGFLPILTAMTSGYHAVPYYTHSYAGAGGTESRPGNIYIKVNNQFFIKTKRTHQTIKFGADYNYDWNSGRGYYNANDSLPLRPNQNGRPRAFADVPGVHNIATYLENSLRWDITDTQALRLQAGVRFSAIQPWSAVSATSLSPRINMGLVLTPWLTLRGGIGWNSKMPSLDYLYPDKVYHDRASANYLPQGAGREVEQLVLYHTHIYSIEKSTTLRNATTRKIELGVDISLPEQRKLSLVVYHDRTPNGYGNYSDFSTYTSHVFTPTQGLITATGQPTRVDYTNPTRIDTIFASKGRLGNTSVSINKGVEFEFDFGRIQALHTNIYLTGAYMQSETYSNGPNYKAPTGLPAIYAQTNTLPFYLIYPSELERSRYRRFSNNLRIVTHIPRLKMVASLSGQVVWHDYAHSTTPAMEPMGYLDKQLHYHPITPAMLADPTYTIAGVNLSAQKRNGIDNVPTKQPITWMLSMRLTKELGKVASISCYANNALYYEPFLASSTTTTLTQRNTGQFSFGVELAFKL